MESKRRNPCAVVRVSGDLDPNLPLSVEFFLLPRPFAENVVFAVGGPGGFYARSVYPAVHTGAIGLAIEAGAKTRNLPEFQYGMASTKFRWNVSGSYMQVLPRIVSRAADGVSDERPSG